MNALDFHRAVLDGYVGDADWVSIDNADSDYSSGSDSESIIQRDDSESIIQRDDSASIRLRDDSESIRLRDDSESISVIEDSESIRLRDDSESISVIEDSESIGLRDDSESISIIEDSESIDTNDRTNSGQSIGQTRNDNHSSPLSEIPSIFRITKTDIRRKKNFSQKKKLKNPRKHENDGMLKKAKSHCLKFVKNRLNKTLEKYDPEIKRKFIKLSGKRIEEIKIQYNKIMNRKTLFEIYTEDERSGKESICRYTGDNIEYHNKKLAEYVLRYEELENLMNMTFKDIYKEFLESAECREHLKSEKEKQAYSYYGEYNSFLKNYIDYCETTTPHKQCA